MIENHLKRLGLVVDLLFPNADVPIGKVLANIASRGCLYAILVTPQNQEMSSATVNVLHGEPAEHRNMPVEDAIDFLVKNFQHYMRGGRNPELMADSNPVAISAPKLANRHSEAAQNLLNLLADNRALTVLQYDCVIKYLQEQREMQVKVELGDSADLLVPHSSTAVINPDDQEKELQKRIMDILNKPSITNMAEDSIISRPQQSNDNYRRNQDFPSSNRNVNEPQLLNDPKVQKALDSLLSNNTFNF